MHKVSKSRNMKERSVSVEDLGTMAKRLIGRALDDSDLIATIHRAICEELCFEKCARFKGASSDKKSDGISSQMTVGLEMVQRDKSEKYSKEYGKSLCVEEKNDENDNLLLIRHEKNRSIADETSVSVTLKNESSNRKLSSSNKARTERPELLRQSQRSTNEETERMEQPFEIWKRKKTKAIRRMLKEEHNRRQQELAAQQIEIERKRAAHEAYLSWKRQRASQRKLEKMQKKAMRDSWLGMQKTRVDENITANGEAFRAWKKKKDSQSRQRTCQPGRLRRKTQNIRHCDELEFDSWLDRLDSVLHQKYLQERRYLIRSMYCQPTYYGSAALS